MNKKLQNTKTLQNLVNAFAGECQACSRYWMMAEVARDKGLNELAKFIKEISTNEYYHSKRIYEFIEESDDKVIDGLKVCSNYPFKEKMDDFVEAFNHASFDEGEEAKEIYPSFARIAKEEGFDDIANFFTNLIQVETCHHLAMKEFYNELKSDTLYVRTPAIKWKCAKCGYEVTSKTPPEICPICKAPKGDIMIEMPE